MLAAAPDGYFAGTTDTYEIRRFSVDGQLRAILRRTIAPQPITNDEREMSRHELRRARREERASHYRGMPDSLLQRIAASEESMFDRIPFPLTYPAYSRLLVDEDGYLWVQSFVSTRGSTAEAREWSVFHPDGRLMGNVTLPERFTLHTVSKQRVFGVYRDEKGLEYVRGFAIIGR